MRQQELRTRELAQSDRDLASLYLRLESQFKINIADIMSERNSLYNTS